MGDSILGCRLRGSEGTAGGRFLTAKSQYRPRLTPLARACTEISGGKADPKNS